MMQRIQIWPVIVVKPLDGLREFGQTHGVGVGNAILVWQALIAPEETMAIPSVMVHGVSMVEGTQNVLQTLVRCQV